MKTLKAIQTISKICKIVSKVLFVLCIVGFCGCVTGVIALAACAETITIDGVTFSVFLYDNTKTSVGTMYSYMAVGMIACAAEAVLAKFAEHYFNRELKDGTPFTIGGSKELMRHGILCVSVSLGASILAGIACGIIKAFFTDVEVLDYGIGANIAFGVTLMVLSLVCRLGAENCNKQSEQAQNEETDDKSEPFGM